MKHLISTLLFLTTSFSFAQQPTVVSPGTTCDLAQQNERWLSTFKTEQKLEEQLNLVRTKISTDTLYTPYNNLPSAATTGTNKLQCSSSSLYYYFDQNGAPCGKKILFFVRNTAKDFLKIDLLEHPSYAPLLAALHAENTTIDLLEGTQATALFGFNGMAGVVLLNVQDKQIEAQLKQLMQNNNT